FIAVSLPIFARASGQVPQSALSHCIAKLSRTSSHDFSARNRFAAPQKWAICVKTGGRSDRAHRLFAAAAKSHDVKQRGEQNMTGPEPKIRKSLISNRELFVCDNVVDMKLVTQIGMMVKTLHYLRKEKSRPGVPGLIAVSDIPTDRV